MQLVSVNIALHQAIEINGRQIMTGIYKQPVEGPVAVGTLGLAGDGQADLSVHGGIHQALYAYPQEHYTYWEQQWGRRVLPPGTFGENLTVHGLIETDICIGDILQIGEQVQLQITMPRIPCFKFGHKIGKPEMLNDFLESGYSGFYLRVLQTGLIQASDEIRIVQREPQQISVRMALGMQKLNEGDRGLLRKALQVHALAPLLHKTYSERLRT